MSYNKNYRKTVNLFQIIPALVLILLFNHQLSANIIIENNINKVVDSIEVKKDGKISLLPVATFIKKIEPDVRWNMLGKKQTIYTSKDTLIFYKGNHFYKVNKKN